MQILSGHYCSSTWTVKKVIDEVSKMECLNHPNVMPLVGVCMSMEETITVGIVMPRMKESLLDYLRENRETLKPKTTDLLQVLSLGILL